MNASTERPGRHPNRTPLPAIATAATAVGLAAILAVAANSVSTARERATKNDARMAGALWSEFWAK